MTLTEILVSALEQLDRGSDAQTLDVWSNKLTRFANDAVVDLAEAIKLQRTDELPVVDGLINPINLPRWCLKILNITVDGKAIAFMRGPSGGVIVDTAKSAVQVTYRCVPAPLTSASDEPDLPEYVHPLIVLYVVARERAAGDVSTQRGANVYFDLYNAGKADLRPNLGEQDTYAIINRW